MVFAPLHLKYSIFVSFIPTFSPKSQKQTSIEWRKWICYPRSLLEHLRNYQILSFSKISSNSFQAIVFIRAILNISKPPCGVKYFILLPQNAIRRTWNVFEHRLSDLQSFKLINMITEVQERKRETNQKIPKTSSQNQPTKETQNPPEPLFFLFVFFFSYSWFWKKTLCVVICSGSVLTNQLLLYSDLRIYV